MAQKEIVIEKTFSSNNLCSPSKMRFVTIMRNRKDQQCFFLLFDNVDIVKHCASLLKPAFVLSLARFARNKKETLKLFHFLKLFQKVHIKTFKCVFVV